MFKKSKEFLSQIPEWEKKYKNSEELYLNYDRNDWKQAKAEFSEHSLHILGEPVMEDWEEPYMKDLANVACSRGGVVLELGFGMAISSGYIQQNNIERHIIIEANKDVAEKARRFAKNSRIQTILFEGLWEETIEQIDDCSLDGILFDTYPIQEEELYQNHFNFFPYAFRKLKKNGIFTYYSDEIYSFSDIHLRRLQEAGFDFKNIKSTVSNVNPPASCSYWKANTILVPIVIK